MFLLVLAHPGSRGQRAVKQLLFVVVSLSKIWLESMHSFDNMHVFWFREFGLKMPIYSPKIGAFGGTFQGRSQDFISTEAKR